MITDYKTLRTENGWRFAGNMLCGCAYQNLNTGVFIYQWGFDTRGNASFEATFKTEAGLDAFIAELEERKLRASLPRF